MSQAAISSLFRYKEIILLLDEKDIGLIKLTNTFSNCISITLSVHGF